MVLLVELKTEKFPFAFGETVPVTVGAGWSFWLPPSCFHSPLGETAPVTAPRSAC
ncbi:hypothetical protein [Nocardia lijiangensis]|uniref:hypothetical protein n=1 Tax=Nocardia lijiangensis TaxID=299618 RepID=UPI003D730F6B